MAALFALAPVCLAQSAPGPLSQPGTSGGTLVVVFGSPPGALTIPTTSGAGFSGAPYSGKQTTVLEKILMDGTKSTETFVLFLWRDAEGRVRTDRILHTKSGEEYRDVEVNDPVAGAYLSWMTGLDFTKRVIVLPNGLPVTALPPTGTPQAKLWTPKPSPRLQVEILPPQEINGVYAVGWRSISTIRLQEENGQRKIDLKNENWTSPDLRIIMRHIHEDPRSGREDTEVTDVVRGDPDPSLFQAPEGYAVVDRRAPGDR
jgi:hypothetical protein